MSRLVFLLAAVFYVTAAPALGAAPDPSFGGGGLVRTFEAPDGSGTQLKGATDVAVQPDGRIVVAADVVGPLGERDWVVVRYLPDGRLDPGFGRGGATVVETGTEGVARALALQPDGKILVTGPATCDWEQCFAALRLNPDGSRDAGFGEGGLARHAPVRRTDAYDVAVQPDGRIVLAGRWFQGGDANDDDLACVMRLLPDGRLDPGFSRDGMVRLDHGYGDDFLQAIAIQGRRIVVAGAGRLIGDRGGFAVVRFRPDGSLDRTFGRRGRRIVSFGSRRWATPLAVSTAPGGRLVIAGNTGRVAHRWQPAVARLTRAGSLDRGFGSGGRVHTRVPPFGGGALAMQVDAGGRVLLAGDAYADTTRDAADWALVRHTRSGRLDRSFAPGGVLRGGFSGSANGASALAIAGDRLVAAGTISSMLGVARYVLP